MDHRDVSLKPGTSKVDPGRAANAKAVISEILQDHKDVAKTARENLRGDYEDNVASLQALDKSMFVGTGGLRLRDFVVETVFRPRPPEEGDQRYDMQADALPTELATDLNCLRRACVYNKADKTTRFEVDWCTVRNWLYEILDQSTKQQPSRYILYTFAGVRGWFSVDPLHRIHNRWHLSLKLSGLQEQWGEARAPHL